MTTPPPRGYIAHARGRVLPGSDMIEIGSEAPAFTLEDQFGRSVSLTQFRGRKHVVLLFYPLDFTAT